MNGDIRIYQGVKFTKDNSYVLDHNQATLLQDLNPWLVTSIENASFIRETEQRVKVPFSYYNCSRCNYMAIRNYPYTSIWTFAFIDRIEYVNEFTTYIYYTIDHFHTWYEFLYYKTVKVIREHASESGPLNLLPEPVTPSQMVQDAIFRGQLGGFSIIMCFTDADNLSGYVAGNMASAGKIKRYNIRDLNNIPDLTDFFNDVDSMQGDYGEIVSIFIYPTMFVSITQAVANHTQYGSPVERIWNIPRRTTIQGYTPKNRKMFTYPYMQLRVDNGEQYNTYRPERFHQHTALAEPIVGYNFKMVGCALPTAELNLYPMYYDGYDSEIGSASLDQDMSEKLPMGAFPQVAFPIDTYKSWIAQNQASALMPILTGMLTAGLGSGMSGAGAGAGVGAVASGVGLNMASAGLSGVSSYLIAEQSAKDQTNHWTGQQGGSLDIAQNLKEFHCQILTPPRVEAERIDQFFSAYGYSADRFGIPNMTTRQNWNYVQVSGSLVYGAIPQEAIDSINSMFNRGVTIWHSYSGFGNYGDFTNSEV